MIKLSAATLAAFLFAGAAHGQQACGPAVATIEGFRLQHGEVPQIEMRDASGHRLIIVANPRTRSWSLFVLPASNETVACLVATGGDFGGAGRAPGRTS
jgi:hypothetical protein